MRHESRVWMALAAATIGVPLLTLATVQRAAEAIPAVSRQSTVARLDSALDGGQYVPVSDKTLEAPDDGDWLMWRRTLNGWGYSPLTEINRQNVGGLTLAWKHDMATTGIQQATPLVSGERCFCRIRPMSHRRSTPQPASFSGSIVGRSRRLDDLLSARP